MVWVTLTWYVDHLMLLVISLVETIFLILGTQIIYCDDSRYVDSGKRDPLFRKLFTDTGKLTISMLFS
jgi:hypothetical protein